jgi:hypothetical protein
LTLALLLLWQCEAALALISPEHAVPATSAHAAHCARQAMPAASAMAHSERASVPTDCCHHASAACECPQLPALAQPLVPVRAPLLAVSPPLLRALAYIEARDADFFRPPI